MEEKKIDRRKFLKGALLSAAAISSLDSVPSAAVSPKTAGSVPAAVVPKKELGTTGVKIPILQLGTSQHLDPVYDKVMHLCYREGVTCLDTALRYGWGASHRAIGTFLKQIDSRKNIWITSKSKSDTPEKVIEDIDVCLKDMDIDYLDLYLMHSVRSVDLLDKKYLAAGDKLRKSGKTRFFGFSSHGDSVVELMNKASKLGSGALDAILFRYNFRQYGDRDLNLAIDACKKAGIGLIAMKTMASVPDEIEQVTSFTSQNFTLGQAKLKSVWADERIDSLLSEMASIKIARENITAAKSQISLTAEEHHQLNQLAALTAGYACNGCSHICETAIGGAVAIADPLRYLMYYECYGKQADARKLYSAVAPQLKQYDSQVLTKAASVCPQGIDIAGRLKKAGSVLA